MADLTQARLKELLHYDPNTGIFTWIKSPKINLTGLVAGCVDTWGYWCIGIDRKIYRAHRLAWLYVFGQFPQSLIIDHINQNKLDNKICNLRLVSHSENGQNGKVFKNNTSGTRGVSLFKRTKKWQAKIYINYKQTHLGYFSTLDEAIEARKAAEKKLYSLPE